MEKNRDEIFNFYIKMLEDTIRGYEIENRNDPDDRSLVTIERYCLACEKLVYDALPYDKDYNLKIFQNMIPAMKYRIYC